MTAELMAMLDGINASPVIPHLWVGSVPPFGSLVGVHFDKLVIVASEHRYSGGYYPGTNFFHVPLSDGELTEDEECSAVQMGRAIASWVRKKKNVFIACNHGLNRACFVACVSLLTLGTPTLEAIEKIRAARGPTALGSPYFPYMLRKLEGARPSRHPLVTLV